MRLLEFTADVNTVDQGEYDREGDMAIGQLNTINDAADELRSILSADDNLPEWVQNKITKAVDYIDTARDYMKSKEQGVAENTAAGINKMFNNLGDPVYANLQRVALLAMQGRQSEAAGRLQTVIKHADPAVQKKITDAVNNIKPVMINGKVADSSTLDKSKAHQDWTLNTFIPWVQSLLGQQGVAEANGRRYSSYNDELSSIERAEQNYMDQSESDFKRAEMQHELGHEDDPNFERNLRQQQLERDQGPWYIRIDGKIYRQSGQPKVFDLKNGANNYALAMIKNNPSLQGKVTLSKSEADR